MENTISREEHEEFRRRMEDEDKRQNKRLDVLERDLDETKTLALNVDRLATNMESMLKEQEKQGKRLEALEGRDGEMWRKVVGYIITAVAGIIIGFVFRQIGIS